MIKLNFPDYQFRVSIKDNKSMIFDNVRKKFVRLTDEEWVRQHSVSYLINEKQCPASLIAVEKELSLNGMKKRTDIVVYYKEGNPLLIVECKAPSIKISPAVFEQAARYNLTLKVNYLMVTNGLQHYCCFIDHHKQSFSYLEEIPMYQQLIIF
ncbi:MAG: type I restriction enzyme HsdR N-terminal domain-containing protein [Bacteroidota bacterium]